MVYTFMEIIVLEILLTVYEYLRLKFNFLCIL